MKYPKSESKKIQKISNILTKYAEQNAIEFSFGGQDIYPLETFAHFGCLSLFLFEAKEMYEKVYNNLYSTQELMAGLGHAMKEISVEQSIKEQEYLKNVRIEKKFPIDFYEQEENCYFGFVPKESPSEDFDFLNVAHFTHYSLEEYVRIYKNNKNLMVQGKIPLDPLFEKMMDKINAQKVVIKPEMKSKSII